MAERITNSKDVNDVIAPYRKAGWRVTNKGTMRVLVPPPEILALNPDLVPFVSLHNTPSDRRTAANILARLKRFKLEEQPKTVVKRHKRLSNEVTSFFCRICGPDALFSTSEQRDTHERDDHIFQHCEALLANADHMVEVALLLNSSKRQFGVTGGPEVKPRQCPVCDWFQDARAFRPHVRHHHPEFAARVREHLLTLDGLEQAANLSWGD